MGAPESNFNIERLETAEHLKHALRILENVFDSFDAETVAQKYRWLNEINPAAESLTYLLKDMDKDIYIGVFSICRRQYQYNGHTHQSGAMIDFAVDKSYRTLGPAMQLLRQGVQAAQKELGFLYGTPNRKASPVFKRAGAKPLGEMNGLVRVLRTEKYIKEKSPGILHNPLSGLLNFCIAGFDYCASLSASFELKGHWGGDHDEKLDQLWAQSDYRNTCISTRNADTIKWRPCNGSVYQGLNLFLVTDKSQQEKPLGYILYWIKGDSIRILDFFTVSPTPTLIKNMWRIFLWGIRRYGKNNVYLAFFGSNDILSALNTVGFVKRESFQIVYFEGVEEIPDDPGQWFMTSFDGDT